jgi:hypothetical protein
MIKAIYEMWIFRLPLIFSSCYKLLTVLCELFTVLTVLSGSFQSKYSALISSTPLADYQTPIIFIHVSFH